MARPKPPLETDMKTVSLALLATLLLAMPLAVRADQASITILSPKDGATLDADETYPLEYEVVTGPGGGFAAVSWFGKGALPEVEGVALWALVIKVACTVLGLAAGVTLLGRRGAGVAARAWLWSASLAAGLGALLGAAFLRWYL